jgi:hypothetical protein
MMVQFEDFEMMAQLGDFEMMMVAADFRWLQTLDDGCRFQMMAADFR